MKILVKILRKGAATRGGMGAYRPTANCIVFVQGRRGCRPPATAAAQKQGRAPTSGALPLSYPLKSVLLHQLAAHQDAHDGGHHQAARPAGGIAQAVQTRDVRLQVGVHLDLVGVELQLGAVQQRFGAGKTGNDLIHHLDELDDVDHGAVGHGGGDITGHSVLQRRADVGAGQLFGPGALAVQDISVALHQNVARAQHIRQLADLLRVGDGLVERLSKIMADEDRQVGVVALLLFEAVAVDDRQIIVVVLLRDKAAGVLAEGAHLVVPRGRVADQLALVQDLINLLHDLVAALDADADVNGAGLVGDVVLGAEFLQPVRAAAARGNDDLLRQHVAGAVLLAQADALADGILQDDVLALGVEQHLDARVGQIVLDV